MVIKNVDPVEMTNRACVIQRRSFFILPWEPAKWKNQKVTITRSSISICIIFFTTVWNPDPTQPEPGDFASCLRLPASYTVVREWMRKSSKEQVTRNFGWPTTRWVGSVQPVFITLDMTNWWTLDKWRQHTGIRSMQGSPTKSSAHRFQPVPPSKQEPSANMKRKMKLKYCKQ